MRRVVITGIGAVTPLGNDIEATWENLIEKKSGIGGITKFDPTGLPNRIAGELKGFIPEDYLNPKDILRYLLLSGALYFFAVFRIFSLIMFLHIHIP